MDSNLNTTEIKGLSFLKLKIEREVGLRVLENSCIPEKEIEKIVLTFVPNGDPTVGSIKVATNENLLYITIITTIEGGKGCVVYRLNRSSIEFVNDLIAMIFNIEVEVVPPWKYQIRFLKGLQYLLSTVLSDGKVIIIGNQLEIILFLLSFADVLNLLQKKNLDGIIYSDSISGIEKFHGIASFHDHKKEFELIEKKCVVDLREGVCTGNISSPLLKTVEKYFRSNRISEAMDLLRELSMKIKSGMGSLDQFNKLDEIVIPARN